MALRLFALVALLTVAAADARAVTQTSPFSDAVFLDVKLSAATAGLLREVERIYGKAVVGEKSALPGGSWASSRIDDDGTPRIRIAPAVEDDEGIIVHELFHLKLRSRGAPVFHWLSDGGEPALDALLALQAQIYDAIQHRAFASDMLALGVEPSARLRTSLRTMIAARTLEGSPGDFGKAIIIARTFLEFGQGPELTSLRRWFDHEGWAEALSLGHKATVALLPTYSEPRDHVRQFLSALRALGVSVALDRYDTVTLGGHRQVRAVVIHRTKPGSSGQVSLEADKAPNGFGEHRPRTQDPAGAGDGTDLKRSAGEDPGRLRLAAGLPAWF